MEDHVYILDYLPKGRPDDANQAGCDSLSRVAPARQVEVRDSSSNAVVLCSSFIASA